MAAITRASVWIGLLPPTRTTTFLFEHAQELGLAAAAEVADFVEEQRTAAGQLELAGPRLVGVGEGALLVTKEFAFQERLGNRGAVDRDERTAAAGA